MDKVEALEALLEKIENGEADEAQGVAKQIASAARDSGNTFPHHLVMKAYSGSLDAAKKLHEAVFLGWEWRLGLSNAVIWLVNGKDGAPRHSGMSHIAARAWLIAILRALIANEHKRAQRGGDAQPAAGNTHIGEAV